MAAVTVSLASVCVIASKSSSLITPHTHTHTRLYWELTVEGGVRGLQIRRDSQLTEGNNYRGGDGGPNILLLVLSSHTLVCFFLDAHLPGMRGFIYF